MKIKALSFLLISIISSCNYNNSNTVYLSDVEAIHLSDLSSASGISIHKNRIYIVGDDNPWLYELNSDLDVINKTQISGIDTLFEGRTPKHLKADFEGAEIIYENDKPCLVIISSGSVIHTRDTSYIINLSGKFETFAKNLRPLHDKIKMESNLPEANEINIEGIAFSEDHAYLVHRGNVSENLIIEINRRAFLDFIKKSKPLPRISIYRFNLPSYKGVSSGFSGVCLNPDNSGLIFTASMEDTEDEINDGKVLGSFVGIIPFSGMANGEYSATLLLDNELPLEKKLEGISIKSVSKNEKMEVITVCDNDDGSSDIITFSILIN